MEVALAALAAASLTVAVTAALLYVAYRRVLRRHLLEEMLRVSGPSIVRALPPQQVMTTLLASIYGDDDANHAFIAGLLGGEGIAPRGADLTISTHTTVAIELRSIDHDICELTSTVGYTFRENSRDHRFVVFATCNPMLRDSIALASRLPLFESWYVPDQALFEDSVDRMLLSARIGMSYTSPDGAKRDIKASDIELTEVLYRDWPEYLRFFREAFGALPRQDPAHYMRTLRIFEYDLDVLAPADDVVSSIENLSLRSTTLQRVDESFCYWQPPYPCYVERMSFEATGLDSGTGTSLLFQVVPFTFQAEVVPSGWITADELNSYSVNSWLLPGHGVALLWRPRAHEIPSPGTG